LEAMERLHADHLDENVERLAHHATRAEIHEKALHYLQVAGRKATARSALPDGRLWFEQALGILGALPKSASLEQRFDGRMELRSVLGLLGQIREVRERLREAEAIADTLDDDRRRGRVLAVLTNAHAHLGEFDAAVAAGTRALDIAERLSDLRVRLLSTIY